MEGGGTVSDEGGACQGYQGLEEVPLWRPEVRTASSAQAGAVQNNNQQPRRPSGEECEESLLDWLALWEDLLVHQHHPALYGEKERDNFGTRI